MAEEYALGLDAGGGSGRALLVALRSGETHSADRSWTHPVAEGIGGMGRDLDLELIWAALCEAAREVVDRVDARPEQIVGLAATSMRHALVAIADDGEVLHAVPNADARAAAEGLRLAAERGAELHQRTGRWPAPVLLAPRLQWLASQQPDAWKRVRFALSLSDWIAYRLCGEVATDRTHGCESLLLDLDSASWSAELAQSLGVPPEVLPPLREPGEPLGRLETTAARELGLAAGTPVAVGAADTSCGLLGVGALEAGQAAIIAGTTAPVQLLVSNAPRDPRLWTGHHVVSGVHALESNAGGMGYTLEFAARAFYADSSHPEAQLLADAAASEPGAAGMQFAGGADIMDATQLALPVCQLTFSHALSAGDPDVRRHFARAIAEGFAYALRGNLEQLERLAGSAVEDLRLGGGMSRSRSWVQIAAAVLARPIRVARAAEATALGAALCGSVAAGRFGTLRDAASSLAQPAETIEPDPDSADHYAQSYAAWLELREARAPADQLARGQQIQKLVGAAAGRAHRATRPRRRPRILVTAQFDETGLAELRRLGDVTHESYRDLGRMLKGDTLIDALGESSVLITEIDLVDVDVLHRCPELRVVASCRGDAVNVDVEACTAFGIPLINAPGRNAHAVADLTLAFLLMLARKLPEATAALRAPDRADLGKTYARLRGRELWQRAVGLIGLGAVGQQVLRRLAAFGARVLVHDPYVPEHAILRLGAEPASLADLLARSDFISLHAAVTESSRGLIGREQLMRMKPGAALVNTARAALVDEEALAESLKAGHLSGAAVDTFSVEPPDPDHPLLRLDQVITTPHIGGNTREVAIHQARIVARALSQLFAAETPRELRNPEVLTSFDWARPRPEPSPERIKALRRRPGPAVSDLQRDQEAKR